MLAALRIYAQQGFWHKNRSFEPAAGAVSLLLVIL